MTFSNNIKSNKIPGVGIEDIVTECETYKRLGSNIFPLAQEICFNEALRRD